MNAILGIDPGGRNTGFCLLDENDRVLDGCVITRSDEDWSLYLRELDETVRLMLRDEMDIAIEEVVKPKPYFRGKKQVLDPRGVMDLSRVYGWLEYLVVLDLGITWRVISPAGNGSGELESYPPQLVGVREQSGKGILHHARSAYDVAITARAELVRLERAVDPSLGRVRGQRVVPTVLPDSSLSPRRPSDPDNALAHLDAIRSEHGA